MYFIPNSKKCAEDFGEGQDAEKNKISGNPDEGGE
jgi:hypothetical protein